ncbi:hypothetical protein CC117_09955 [Parafrankia colletiae]|uniref:Septum formation-related domain-containing protein n=1 Tax=Parafrankia colletiae TaxID=573497 RepID=A0A1S1REV2_9ACTN|nr:septum formation family protein [Parafrankia colletiae]MCK9901128.1 septum formation family protein [Frankia sp. Cpl3]OHV43995.1 hypothetical protein CC117_09955 [Parafrankia colletiae]
MASQHPDPFEDVRLDERFVRSARFLEPSARERTGQMSLARGARCGVVPAPRGLQGLVYRLFVAPPRPAPRARRLTWVLAVLTLAVGMISLTFVALRHTARGVPVASTPLPPSGISVDGTGLASTAAADGLTRATSGLASSTSSPVGGRGVDPALGAPGGFALAPDVFRSLAVGDCLTWAVMSVTPLAIPGSGDAPAPRPVACTEPHLDEITRIVDLSGRFGSWPGAARLGAAAADDCAESLRDYFGGLDAAPHHVVGSVRPDQASWERGVHSIVCTIRADDLLPDRGRFAPPGIVRS